MADVEAGGWRSSVGSALGMTVSVFAVSVPLLYVIGRVFSDAYWREIGIDSGLMGVSVEEYVYSGFVTIANVSFHFLGIVGPSLTWLWLAALALLAIVVLSGVLLLAWFGRGLRALVLRGEKSIGKLKRADGSSVRFVRAYFVSGQVVNSAFLAIVAPVFLLALAIHGVGEFGRLRAGIALENVQKTLNGSGKASSVALSEGRRRLVVSCATEWCVLVDATGLVAVPRDSISTIAACSTISLTSDKEIACTPVRPGQK